MSIEEQEEERLINFFLNGGKHKKQKLTKCCNAPAKMTNHEKGIQSNVQFMVCSECGKGDLWRFEGIKIEDINNNK